MQSLLCSWSLLSLSLRFSPLSAGRAGAIFEWRFGGAAYFLLGPHKSVPTWEFLATHRCKSYPVAILDF